MDIRKILEEKILPFVEKPGRYTGGEWGSVVKPWEAASVRSVLLFAEVYEIGMSSQGIQILYGAINARPGLTAERAYLPWFDMMEKMRENGVPLYSLESFRPLADFDVVAASLQYELGYTNLLQAMALSGTPVWAAERPAPFPLWIGGGPSAATPEPLADFLDAMVVGDGEEVFLEILELIGRMKPSSPTKRQLLEALAGIEGVYVPSLYEPVYHPDGTLQEMRRLSEQAPRSVRRRVVKDLDRCSVTSRVVPLLNIVHDRLGLEIFRGCTRGCRFCQAGMMSRPVRERSVDPVLRSMAEAVTATGYEEISFSSLSSGDYSAIRDLVPRAMEDCRHRRVALSLSSLRLDGFSASVASEIRTVRRTGLTFAPEAGSERLRRSINKEASDEVLMDNVRQVFEAGWESIKLYFMTGLPGETPGDLDGILRMVRSMRDTGRRIAPVNRVTVGISSFVPKSHTPFQWAAQDPLPEMERKLTLLRQNLRGIQVTWQDPKLSFLEGVFSRGDRRLGRVLFLAWTSDCLFDGWNDRFRWDLWQKAFADAGVDPAFYTGRERGKDEVFPWDVIDCGVTKDYLWKEKEKADRGEPTEDCRYLSCHQCGACTPEAIDAQAMKHLVKPRPDGPGTTRKAPPEKPEPLPKRQRLRLRYAKTGRLRWISHLDLMATLRRVLTRAGVPMGFSAGFHPKPLISFGPALSLGFTSSAEYLDLTLFQAMSAAEVMERVNAQAPEGFRVVAVKEMPLIGRSLDELVRAAEYRVTGYPAQDLTAKVLAMRQDEGFKGIEAAVAEDGLHLRLPLHAAVEGVKAKRTWDVLETLLGMPMDQARGLMIERTGLFALSGGQLVEPWIT